MAGHTKIISFLILFTFAGIIYMNCSGKKIIPKEEELQFELLNPTVKDGEKLKVRLSNLTNKDYCLVLDTLSLSNPVSFFASSNFFASAFTHLVNFENKVIPQTVVDYECYPNDKKAFEEEIKIFDRRTVKSLLKIKANTSLTFYAPFKLKTIITKECWYGYNKENLNDEKGYLVKFKYHYYSQYALKAEMRDSIKTMGYEIYEKPILSNGVPLILK
ncbi:MAG TPA: hypothetical protein VF677_08780 [Flavobacterium sp.]|jgi:hypothetical protein